MRSRTPACTALAAAAVIAAVLASMSLAQQSSNPTFSRAYVVPVPKIMTLGEHVVKLDTRTGAMSVLSGGADVKDSSAGQWLARVPAVSGPTSGMLEIVPLSGNSFESVFLIDVNEDRTWILRWRGNENGYWLAVNNHH